MMETVLLAGGTGMLGSRIATHLLDNGRTRLRLLVREARNDRRRDVIEPLRARGAEVVEGELSDVEALIRATQGVDVIVSALQGGPDVIVEGQVALAAAGKRTGVRRILPSDYALDLFKATPGEHMMFDMRAKADARIAELGLEQVNVLQGAFMDMLMPGKGAIDLDKGTVTFYGDGNRSIEITSVEDTARMIARVALDRGVASGKFAFAGDHISFRQAADILSTRTARAIRPVSLGSEADLRAAMASADPPKKVMLAYMLYMTNGQTSLSDLQNDRYSDLKLEKFDAFAARTLSASTRVS